MKKIFITVLIALGVLLLLQIAMIVIVYNIRLHQMWDQFDVSVMPNEAGTSWETEDGFLSYRNVDLVTKEVLDESGNAHYINYRDCPGTIHVDGEELVVHVSFSQEGTPRMHLVLDVDSKNPRWDRYDIYIETWIPKDYIETDNEIIFILAVEETTYYKVGQEIKLIYKKK